MKKETYSLKKTARLAGLLFVIWIVTGMYDMLFVSARINANGTAINIQAILSNEFVFRTGITADLISSITWIFLVLVLHRLFNGVDKRQAILLVALVLVQIPVIIIMEAFKLSSLMIVKGEILKTSQLSQRSDLDMLFLKVNDYATTILVTFWGLWLLPLATLVYKSRFLPRFLGVWLFINGCAYIVLSFTGVLLPQYYNTLYKILIPAFFGELVFMLWLLIKGAKDPNSRYIPS